MATKKELAELRTLQATVGHLHELHQGHEKRFDRVDGRVEDLRERVEALHGKLDKVVIDVTVLKTVRQISRSTAAKWGGAIAAAIAIAAKAAEALGWI